MRGRLRAPGRRGDESGAAAVETALCLGVLVLPIVFAMIAYGYMFSFREALSQATTEGARAAVGAPAGQPALGIVAAQTAVTRSLSTYGMTCTPAGTLVDKKLKTVGTCTASYDRVCLPTSATPCHVTVVVSHDYRAHSLLPSVPGLGFTLPEQIRFTSVVEAG